MTREIKAAELSVAAAIQEAATEVKEAVRKFAEVNARGASVAYSEPQPDWLPWHMARFCFLPHFAHPDKDFSQELKLLIEKLSVHDDRLEFDTTDPGECVIRRGSVRLIVDARDGRFSIDAFEENVFVDSLSTSGEEVISGCPEEFFSALQDLEPMPCYREDAEALMLVSNAIWTNLQERFSRALREGAALAFGRWRDIDRAFERVTWDQLLQLKPELVETDAWSLAGDVVSVLRLQGSSTVAVLSPHVAPSISYRRSKGTKDEDDATAALIAEMNSNRDAPRPKEQIFRDLQQRFRGITKDGFRKRIWPDALAGVTQDVRSVWGRAGRRTRRM